MKKTQVIKILKQLPQLKTNAKIAQMRVSIIETALDVLTNEEKTIVDRMIIKGEEPETVSFELHIERSSLYRKKEQCLLKIGRALYGDDIAEQNEG